MIRCAMLVGLFVPAAVGLAQPPRVPVPLAPGSPGVVRPIRPTMPVPAGPIQRDRHGDPLPAGAISRLGTVRLRHGAEPAALGFTFEGKYLGSISDTNDGIRIWDPVTGKELARLETPLYLAAFMKDGNVVIADETK